MTQILAKEGDAERYIITHAPPPFTVMSKVHILDAARGTLSDERVLGTVLSQGEWDPYTGDQDALSGLLAQVPVPSTQA